MKRTTITAMFGSCLCCGLLAAGSPDRDGAEEDRGARAMLAHARDDLGISRLTLERIQKDLDALRQQEGVDPSVLEDYAIYLDKVRAMMEAHQSIVRGMEGVSGETAPALAVVEWQQSEPVFDPPIPERVDELSRLDRELDQALAAFDAFLLDEQYEAARRMEQIEEASSEEMTALAREAAAAVERLRKKGIEIDTRSRPGEAEGEGDCAPGSGGAEGAEGQSGEPATGDSGSAGSPEGVEGGAGNRTEGAAGAGETGEPGTGRGDEATGGPGEPGAGEAQGSGSGAGGTGEPTATHPADSTGSAGETNQAPPTGDRPPADDDDIVARQLREAAEKETDPVLKEKLWQEYEKYKGSS